MRQTMTMNFKRALREPFTARAGRELCYSLLSLPLACLGAAMVIVTIVLGILSMIVIIIPLLPVFLALDRTGADLYRFLARVLLRLPIQRPGRAPRQRGLLGFLVYHLADPVAWRAVAYFAVRFPLGVLQFMLALVFWIEGLVLTFYLVLWKVESPGPHLVGGRMVSGLAINGFYFDTVPRAILLSCFGLLVVLAAPWVSRGPLVLDRWLLARLLGPSASSLRILELERTRSNAINEAAMTLRRIERDLHDGAQVRLVALGMRLGRVRTRLDRGDAEQAKVLLGEAQSEVKEIVAELRELVRGIHPPALDAGLAAALATLAARSQIPTTVRVDLDFRPSASTETVLYFAAAELLANAAKHSRADQASIGLASDGTTLRLTVADDGVGGATVEGLGSGLRGLAERVRTLDGALSVSSPVGGPTMTTIDLPAEYRSSAEDRRGGP
jgi:signal transduction histidine kinase